MKTLKLFLALIAALCLTMTSCTETENLHPTPIPGVSLTTAEVILGTWTTSDGGSISFKSDGTGHVDGSDFFLVDLFNGPVPNFEYQIKEDQMLGETIKMEYMDDGDNVATLEMGIEVVDLNTVEIGIPALGWVVTLQR